MPLVELADCPRFSRAVLQSRPRARVVERPAAPLGNRHSAERLCLKTEIEWAPPLHVRRVRAGPRCVQGKKRSDVRFGTLAHATADGQQNAESDAPPGPSRRGGNLHRHTTCTLGHAVAGATITVRADDDLQAALDRARPGDTVLLEAGAT